MEQISAKILRDSPEVLALPLRSKVNLLIKLSTINYQDWCKSAKVKPKFKKGARTDPKNY